MTNQCDTEAKALIWLQPFSVDLWFTMIALVLMAGAVIWFLERGEPKSYFDKHKDMSVYPGALKGLYVATGFLTNTAEFIPVTYLGRCFISVWAFVMLVTVSAYTANFAAFLTQQQPVNNINTMDAFIESGGTACISEGNANLEYVQKFYPSTYHMPWALIGGSLQHATATTVGGDGPDI